MALKITAATIDGYIDQALTSIETGNYVQAKRYVVMAQTAKQALHKYEAEDGRQFNWDTQIKEILESISMLEAAESKSGNRRRTIKTKTGFGR